MIAQVELNAWGNGQLRQVRVPEGELLNAKTFEDELELIFKFGQNDFAPKPQPSVSVGDVIRHGGKRFLVKALGFQEVAEDEHNRPMTREERFDAAFDFS